MWTVWPGCWLGRPAEIIRSILRLAIVTLRWLLHGWRESEERSCLISSYLQRILSCGDLFGVDLGVRVVRVTRAYRPMDRVQAVARPDTSLDGADFMPS